MNIKDIRNGHISDGELVLIAAVRYSLGRYTYMPSTVIHTVGNLLEECSKKTLVCMERDVREWMGKNPNGPDYKLWSDFADRIKTVREAKSKGVVG